MVEEVWAEHLKTKLSKNDSRLEFLTKTPTFVEAILLSKELENPSTPKIPLLLGFYHIRRSQTNHKPNFKIRK